MKGGGELIKLISESVRIRIDDSDDPGRFHA